MFSALAARYDGMIFEDYVTGTEQGNQEQPGEKLGKKHFIGIRLIWKMEAPLDLNT